VNEWSLLEHLDFVAVLSGDQNAQKPDLYGHHPCFQYEQTVGLPVQTPDLVGYLTQSSDCLPGFPSHQNEHQFDLRLRLLEHQQHSLAN
jgi:hypothetical protein